MRQYFGLQWIGHMSFGCTQHLRIFCAVTRFANGLVVAAAAQASVSPRTNNINGHCCCTRRMCHTQFAEGKWSWDRLFTYQLVKHIQGGVVQGVKGRSGYCRQSQSALRSSEGRGGIGATKTNTSKNMFMV